MRRSLRRLLALLSAVTLFASLATAAPPRARTLTVVGGSGSGEYAKKTVVGIRADANPPGMVFDRWTGDTKRLADALAAATTIKMPGRDVSVTATFKPAPAVEAVTESIAGVQVSFYFPPEHDGVIFRFHGSGGSGAAFFTKVEERLFAADAAARGFALVSLDSEDRATRQWDNRSPLATNPDVANVRAVLDALELRGLIRDGEPLFGVGGSNGGAFVTIAGAAFDFAAQAVYIASGSEPALAASAVPTTWCLAENDSVIGADGRRRAEENYASLVARGVSAELRVHAPSPVTAARLARIPGLGDGGARDVVAALARGGFLDANGYLIDNPRVSNWRGVVPSEYGAQLGDVEDQLLVCYAEHQFFSDFDSFVLGRFEAERDR